MICSQQQNLVKTQMQKDDQRYFNALCFREIIYLWMFPRAPELTNFFTSKNLVKTSQMHEDKNRS